MKQNKYLLLVVLVAATYLTGCGGGGGGTTTPSTPIAQACTNAASNYPDCNSIPAKLQLTIVEPPYPADSEDMRVFKYLNDLRSSLGLGQLSYSKELDQSSLNHLNYSRINQVGEYDEDPSKPGFTGATLFDRVRNSGYTNTSNGLTVSGGLAPGNSKLGSLNSLINSIYHRHPLFNQSFTDIGSAFICVSADQSMCNKGPNGEILGNVLMVTVASQKNITQRNASDFFMVYPRDNANDVNISMIGETINPFPQYPEKLVWGKVGYPISVAVEASQTLSTQTFTITESGSINPMLATLFTMQSDPNKMITKNETYLVANSALKPLTKYTINFVGTASIPGSQVVRSISKTWSFTTNEFLKPR